MDKIAAINRVIAEYFEKNKGVDIIAAKELMPLFIRSGIFAKDEKGGLPIRRILRDLDKKQQLSKIPSVIAVRKDINTNWFFGRQAKAVVTGKQQQESFKKIKTTPTATVPTSGRKNSDEHYILDLCDEILKEKSSRQHRFDFLRGDAGTRLPVDAYYEKLNLVIEFNEQQHTKAVKHFDKPDKLTVSGVHRGEQRKLYDKRKRTLLPQHGIQVIDIPYDALVCDRRGKIMRDKESDMKVVKVYLKKLRNN